MKVLILFSFTALFSFNCFASSISKETCLDKIEFSLSFNTNEMVEAKITKSGSKLRFLLFQGRGEKLELDLSRGDISIDDYPSMESKKAQMVRAGSANCSKPLFGADFDLKEGEADRYAGLRDKIFSLFAQVQAFYSNDKTLPGKLGCTEEILKDYLNNCLSIEAASRH